MKFKIQSVASVVAALTFSAVSAKAQDSFPDVPTNHWAYQALHDLKAAGLLIGYPDGLYRGTRPLSRYELAVAMNAAYTHLKSHMDEIQTALDSYRGPIIPWSDQKKNLEDLFAQIQDRINEFQKFQPEIAELKRASETFELELEALGVNVEAMKQNLSTLEGRISKLEKRKLPVNISGQVDFWSGESDSRYGSYGLNKDGRILGYGGLGSVSELFPPVNQAVGLDNDRNILHEAAFTVSGTNDKGPQWTGTFVMGNMLGNFNSAKPTVAFGNQSDVFNSVSAVSPAGGLIGYNTPNEDIYVQDASVSLGGPKANIEVGRLGYSLNPYMFRRIDNTSYFSNERWDNGQYYFDGFLGGAQLGPASLTVFGGRNSGLLSAKGVELNPVRSGPIGGFLASDPTVASGQLSFDRSLGADLKVGVGKHAHLDLGYVLLESDSQIPIDIASNANHLSVYGADAEAQFGSANIQAGYHKSDVQEESQTVVGKNNSASNIRVGFGRSFYDLFAEYRQVEANYVAPGDWGRLGILRDPTNIKGMRFGGKLKFLRRFTLDAHGDFEAGLSNTYADNTFLGTATGIHGYDVRLNCDVNPSFSLFAEYENTTIGNLAFPANYVLTGNPSYRWATFGMGYQFNKNAHFNVQYELDDIDNDYQVSGAASFHGGFLTSQITVKF